MEYDQTKVIVQLSLTCGPRAYLDLNYEKNNQNQIWSYINFLAY